MRKHLFCLLIIMMYSFGSVSIPYAYSMHTTINTPMQQYHSLQKELAKGWNTWDTRSVLTHVYLPYGFAIDLNLIDMNGHRASQFKVGARGIDKPILKPHAYLRWNLYQNGGEMAWLCLDDRKCSQRQY